MASLFSIYVCVVCIRLLSIELFVVAVAATSVVLNPSIYFNLDMDGLLWIARVCVQCAVLQLICCFVLLYCFSLFCYQQTLFLAFSYESIEVCRMNMGKGKSSLSYRELPQCAQFSIRCSVAGRVVRIWLQQISSSIH